MRGLEEAHQVVRLQVLDDLNRDQAAQRAVRLGVEPREGVGAVRAQAARAAGADHLVVDVDAAGVDAVLAKQVQQLAAAAPDVDHVARRRRTAARYGQQALADLLARAAEPILEADVLERIGVRARRRRWRGADRGVA